MEVWSFTLSDRIDSRGVSVWFTKGEQTEVDGAPYVRMHGGTLVPMGPNWYLSEEKARSAAASKIASYVHALSAQYASLREKADAVA